MSDAPQRQGLTAERRIRILTAARLGLSQRPTAAIAKVPQSSLSDWLASDPEFAQEYAEAQEERMARVAECLLDGAEEDPDLALKVLERRDPEAWMRKEGRELTGAGGGPVETVVATEKHEQLAARVGKLLSEGTGSDE